MRGWSWAIGFVGCCALAGWAAGSRWAAPDPSIEATVRRAAEAIDRDDFAAVWAMLAPETIAHYEKSRTFQAAAMRVWRDQRDAGTGGPCVQSVIAETERRWGAPIDELATAPASEVWADWVRASLQRRGGERARFADLAVDEIAVGERHALVHARLPGGGEQGFQLVRCDDGWRLVDFMPYAALPSAAPRPSGARFDAGAASESAGAHAAPPRAR